MYMYELFSDKSLWLALALAGCFMVSGPAMAMDSDKEQRDKTVNCHEGHKSVQSAIDKVKAGRDTTIFIVGFCDESVSITKSGITLSGNRDGVGAVAGGLREVRVTGAQRVTVEYLELTGDGYGVLAQEGAAVTIRHNNIHDNMASGVGAFNQVFSRIESNRITHNGLREEYGSGIDSSGGVTIRSAGNFIADNDYAAIAPGNQSFFRSQASSGDPATRDTFLQRGCLGGEPAGDCGVPRTFAVDCFKNTLCDFRGTNVTGSIEIASISTLEARRSTIDGHIAGYGGSRLELRDTVSSGSVSCGEATIDLYFNPCGQSFP